jgi:hypothetical protein
MPPRRKNKNKKVIKRPTVVIKQSPLTAREQLLQTGKVVTTAAMPHTMSVRDALMQRMTMGVTPVPAGSNAAEMAMNDKYNQQKAMNDKTQGMLHELQVKMKQEADRKTEFKLKEHDIKNLGKQQEEETDMLIKNKKLDIERAKLNQEGEAFKHKKERINQEMILMETEAEIEKQKNHLKNMEVQNQVVALQKKNQIHQETLKVLREKELEMKDFNTEDLAKAKAEEMKLAFEMKLHQEQQGLIMENLKNTAIISSFPTEQEYAAENLEVAEEISTLRKEIWTQEVTKTENDNKQQRYLHLVKKRSELADRNNDLSSEIDAHKLAAPQLRRRLAQEEAGAKTIIANNVLLESSVRQKKEEEALIEDQLNYAHNEKKRQQKLQNELDMVTMNVDELTKIKPAEKENRLLMGQIAAKETEVEKKKAELSRIQKSIQYFTGNEDQLEELQRQKELKEAEIEEYTNTLPTEKELKESMQKLSTLTTQVMHKKAEAQRILDKHVTYEGYKNKNEDLQQQLDISTTEHDTLKETVPADSDVLAALKEKAKKEGELGDMKDDIQILANEKEAHRKVKRDTKGINQQIETMKSIKDEEEAYKLTKEYKDAHKTAIDSYAQAKVKLTHAELAEVERANTEKLNVQTEASAAAAKWKNTPEHESSIKTLIDATQARKEAEFRAKMTERLNDVNAQKMQAHIDYQVAEKGGYDAEDQETIQLQANIAQSNEFIKNRNAEKQKLERAKELWHQKEAEDSRTALMTRYMLKQSQPDFWATGDLTGLNASQINDILHQYTEYKQPGQYNEEDYDGVYSEWQQANPSDLLFE